MLGVNEVTITRWSNEKENPLPILEKGRGSRASKYDPQALVEWRINRILPAVEKEASVVDFQKERARHEKAKADAQELKNDIEMSRVSDVIVIAEVLASIGSQIVSILNAIPANIKNRVPKLTNSEIEIIKREIVKAQNAAADIGEAYKESEE